MSNLISSKDAPQLIKFIKRGIKKLNKPEEFAVGACVELVKLDNEGLPTTEKYIGRIDKDGDTAELNSVDKGISLGQTGTYLVSYYGSGMEILSSDGSLRPFQEVFNAINTEGFASSVKAGRRMVIDYELSQLQWYDDLQNLVALFGFFNVSGAIVPAIQIVNEVNASDTFIVDFRSKNTSSSGTAYGVKAIAAADYPFGAMFQNEEIDGTLLGRVVICGKNGIGKTFIIGVDGDGLTTSISDYFLLNEREIASFLRGKLGIGDGKDTPAEEIDVKENISCDGRFKSGGGLGTLKTGGNGTVSFEAVDPFNPGSTIKNDITITGGIISSWQQGGSEVLS